MTLNPTGSGLTHWSGSCLLSAAGGGETTNTADRSRRGMGTRRRQQENDQGNAYEHWYQQEEFTRVARLRTWRWRVKVDSACRLLDMIVRAHIGVTSLGKMGGLAPLQETVLRLEEAMSAYVRCLDRVGLSAAAAINDDEILLPLVGAGRGSRLNSQPSSMPLSRPPDFQIHPQES